MFVMERQKLIKVLFGSILLKNLVQRLSRMGVRNIWNGRHLEMSEDIV
jgi:hypothetical protein